MRQGNIQGDSVKPDKNPWDDRGQVRGVLCDLKSFKAISNGALGTKLFCHIAKAKMGLKELHSFAMKIMLQFQPLAFSLQVCLIAALCGMEQIVHEHVLVSGRTESQCAQWLVSSKQKL